MAGRPVHLLLAAAALTFALPAPRFAAAQVIVQQARDDVPVLTRLLPAAVQRGGTAEIKLTGERLDGLIAILCEADVQLAEVVASDDKGATLRLKAGEDAATGFFTFHVLCKAGLSNPRVLRIDDVPQSTAPEGAAANTSLAAARPLQLPGAVSGMLPAARPVYYKLQVAAGQRLQFEVAAARLGSPLEPVLTLYDERGEDVATCFTPPADVAPDMRWAHTFDRGGSYTLRLADRAYQGGDYCVYQLRVGPLHCATAMFPLGGRRGETTRVTLTGGSLVEPLVHEVDVAADAPWRTTRLAVPTAEGRLQAPCCFEAGDAPEFTETEPNDDPEHAESITLPVTVNGRIGTARDRDCFRFSATKDQKLLLRVAARALGSRLDSVLTVYDAAGRQLATADDTSTRNEQPPVLRVASQVQSSDDPTLEFTAPADGQYVVALDDCYYQGGPEWGYRLHVGPPRADFRLLVQPGQVTAGNNRRRQRRRVSQQFAGAGTGALSLDQGGRGSLVVMALRRGFDGPIRITAEGLPSDVQAAEVVMPAGQNQVALAFQAGFDAASTARFVRVLGTAEIEGRTLTRQAEQPVVLAALPINGAVERTLDSVAVGVSGRGAALTMRAKLTQPLHQAGTASLQVEVRRREGVEGAVRLQALNVPAGLQVADVTIPAGGQTAEVPLTAELDVAPGRRVLSLEASLQPGNNQPAVTATAPVQIDVQPLVVLALGATQLELARGGTATVAVEVSRAGGRRFPIELAPARLPRGVSLESTTIPGDVDSFSLQFEADPTAASSALRRIVQIQPTVTLQGRNISLPVLRVALKVTRE